MLKSDLDFNAIEQYAQKGDYAKLEELLQGKKDKSADLYMAFVKFHQKDAEGSYKLLLSAVKNKCLKAYAYLTMYYADEDAQAPIALKFMKKNLKVKDAYMKYLCARYLYMEHGNYAKALPLFAEAKKLAQIELQDNSPYARCFKALCPFPGHTPQNLYSSINGDMLIALEQVGKLSDRSLFIQCWKDCINYSTDMNAALRYTIIYLCNVLDDNMRLADYRNSVDAFQIMLKLYEMVDQQIQEEYREYYDAICEAHEEFIESERQRLARISAQSVTYCNDIVNQSFFKWENLLGNFMTQQQDVGSSQSKATKWKLHIYGSSYLPYELDDWTFGGYSDIVRHGDNTGYKLYLADGTIFDENGNKIGTLIGYKQEWGEFDTLKCGSVYYYPEYTGEKLFQRWESVEEK